jgi:hypothetical protein
MVSTVPWSCIGRDGQCNLQHNLVKRATNYPAEEELIRDSMYSKALSIPQWLLWPSLSHSLNR